MRPTFFQFLASGIKNIFAPTKTVQPTVSAQSYQDWLHSNPSSTTGPGVLGGILDSAGVNTGHAATTTNGGQTPVLPHFLTGGTGTVTATSKPPIGLGGSGFAVATSKPPIGLGGSGFAVATSKPPIGSGSSGFAVATSKPPIGSGGTGVTSTILLSLGH